MKFELNHERVTFLRVALLCCVPVFCRFVCYVFPGSLNFEWTFRYIRDICPRDAPVFFYLYRILIVFICIVFCYFNI